MKKNILSLSIAFSLLFFAADSKADLLGSGISATKGGSMYTPDMAPNIKVWLEADSGVTRDGSNFASSWTDASGMGNTMGASGTAKPLWQDARINGKPALLFDGSDDFMKTASGSRIWHKSQERNLFIVLKHISYQPGQTNPRWLQFRDDGDSGTFLLGSVNQGGQIIQFGDGQVWDGKGTTPVFGAFKLYTVAYNGSGSTTPGNWTMSEGTNSLTMQNFASGVPSRAYAENVLGGVVENGVSPVQFFNGEIAAIIAYGALSASDITNVKNYLNLKYGL